MDIKCKKQSNYTCKIKKHLDIKLFLKIQHLMDGNKCRA